MIRLLARWRKLSREERFKYQAVMGLLIVALYGGLVFPRTYKRYFEAGKLVHRKQDRMEKRASIENLGDNIVTPKVVQKKIARVEEQIAEVNASFDELDSGFAPEDSSAIRQQLMLEVSKLADRTGLEILTARRKGFSVDKTGKVGGRSILDPLIDRPLLSVTAQAPFVNLQDFLRGLKDLSFHMAVMKLKVYSGEMSSGAGQSDNRKGRIKDVPPGYLYIDLEVSI